LPKKKISLSHSFKKFRRKVNKKSTFDQSQQLTKNPVNQKVNFFSEKPLGSFSLHDCSLFHIIGLYLFIQISKMFSLFFIFFLHKKKKGKSIKQNKLAPLHHFPLLSKSSSRTF
jgi:hypothetical protein